MILRAAALLIVCFFGIACDEPPPTAPSRADVLNQTWRLQSIERPDGSRAAVSTPDRFTLQFADTGRLTVRADCNVCNGTFQLNGIEFLVGPMACTRAFCGTESLDTEFLRVFDARASIVAADGALFISHSGTRLGFRP
jgi:heat shock protein HslJ